MNEAPNFGHEQAELRGFALFQEKYPEAAMFIDQKDEALQTIGATVDGERNAGILMLNLVEEVAKEFGVPFNEALDAFSQIRHEKMMKAAQEKYSKLKAERG